MASSDHGPHAHITLVLGGARSGKSLYAETTAEEAATAAKPGGLYLATAEAGDAEMTARIAEHKARRGPEWKTVEEPLDIAAALAEHARADRPVLVDCLTLWLANVIAAGRDPDDEVGALVETLEGLDGPVVLVSNEVGMGIVPESALARSYRDHAGRMNQAVARTAQRVVLISAGLPQVLKDENR
ncbi:MAG: bifunctional adenosylcobinamide kinase/adenosylcobinamide-phosphate guanylyltransferase [Rhodospirillales bacterium]